MATSQMSEVIRHLRRTVLLPDVAGLTDGQLLENFISHRDGSALETLVQRHGPMVWGVCCRVLSNHHDAEDAFQVTFLVLVRKAASIASRELLPNWLYRVAYQTALKARATAAKRMAREKQVTEMPEPEAAQREIWHDLQPLLDQELSRLPDKYRIPILLCDLEGKTRREAAEQLGCPEGTVAGRLARARVLLAKRLTERGVALSGGALAVMLSQNAASACVPTSVVTTTIKTAALVAAGQAAATGLIPAKVAALTDGVLKAMLMTKLKTAMTVLLGVTLLITAGGLLTYGGVVPGKTEQPVNAAAKHKEAKGEADEPAWGEAVEGVQARLRPAKARWKADDVLTFQLDLRNQGDKTFSPVRQPTFCEIEFDGKWYIYGGMVQVNSPASSLPPGKQIDGWVKVVLDESWVRKTPDRVVGGAIQAKGEEWLSMTPGKHSVRVASASKVEAVRPVSNMVEIDIPKGKENNAWGKAVGGIQARLRPKKQQWKADEAPVFELDLRNEGEKPLLYASRLPIFCEVEVDGTWYGWNLDKPIRARISELTPHEQVNGWVAVSFDGSWLKGITGADRNKPVDKGHPIRLASGKHAIRVRFDPGLEKYSPMSNAVEIEVKKVEDKE